jgi:hypothetical protein
LVGKPEGNRSLRRTRSRWEDNNKIDFQEIKWGRRLDRCRDFVNTIIYLLVQ